MQWRMLHDFRSTLKTNAAFLRGTFAGIFPRFIRTDGRLSWVNVVELPELQTIGVEAVAGDAALLKQAFARAVARMRSQLSAVWTGLTDVDFAYVFASTAAHRLKPYGPGCPSQQFSALLEAPFLDCSNYGLLAYYISLLLVDETDRRSISFIGWDGGAVGNHQMLFVGDKGKKPTLALDPTLGIACIADFDEVASGNPIPPDAVAIIGASAELKDSRQEFIRALLEGQFRPSDLLYYFHTAEDYLSRYGNPFDWPTPAVSVLRNRSSVVA